MVKMQEIRARFGANVCRGCINSVYGTNLLRADCLYEGPYPHVCIRCGEVKNIVADVRLSGKWKLFWAHSGGKRSAHRVSQEADHVSE